MERFVPLAVIANIVLYHYPFFGYVIDHLNFQNASAYLIFASIIVALLGVNLFLFFLMAALSSKLLKGFLILSALFNAVALYFIQTYNVILGRAMMGNVFNTRYSEASAYYDPKLLAYLLLLGVIPALIIYKTELKPAKRLRLALLGVASLLLSILILYLNSFSWLWLDKHAKYLGGLSMPWSYSINALRYEIKKQKKSQRQKRLPDGKFTDNQKRVVVLVIGESARADHFSLYGYPKPTSPELEKADIIALPNTDAAATYTTASVAAILSHKGSTSDNYEPLTSYLHRMGAYVEWRTNNWGEPKQEVDRYFKSSDLNKECQGSACKYDMMLLTNLEETILQNPKKKILIVLHTAGSHGPSYNQKYPPEFEYFKPVCTTVDLKQCSKEALFNAYDNTIRYTDYFLAQTIKKLEQLHLPAIMLYISDHGESLGEYNLYLHGTPYAIAPDCQKRVPFILWESKTFLEERGYQKPYAKKEARYGHHMVFHTILDALSLDSPLYKPEWDLLRSNGK